MFECCTHTWHPAHTGPRRFCDENPCMIDQLKRALDKGVELNERLAAAANNGFDWLFRREQLVLSGQTDYALVHEGELMSVRHYTLQGDTHIPLADGSILPIARRRFTIPLVLVPPLGVTTDTFDLLPNRSLVRYMAARGFKVYLICWGKPERRHAHLGLKAYADEMMGQALAAVRAHSKVHEVSLMGWCMGGLLALLHAGLQRDAGIRAIVTVASPVDLQGGGMVAGVAQAINTPAQLVQKYTNFRMLAVNPQSLHMPGWMTTVAFKMTDPVGSLTTYWDLVTRLWDREFVESHSTTSDYLNNMLVYPAGMVQDMLVRVMIGNRLGRGEVPLGGKKTSRLGNIHAPLLVFAGETDNLVSASAARGSLDVVSSTDKTFEVAPGGHMGVILGASAQTHVWARSADWLAKRSAAQPAKTSRTPRAASGKRKNLAVVEGR